MCRVPLSLEAPYLLSEKLRLGSTFFSKQFAKATLSASRAAASSAAGRVASHGMLNLQDPIKLANPAAGLVSSVIKKAAQAMLIRRTLESMLWTKLRAWLCNMSFLVDASMHSG